MKILHINTQSVRNKIDELTAESSEYEILVLTETWLHPNILSEEITIPFFNKPYRKDRTGDAHGGVAIYTRSNLTSKHRTDLEIDNLEATWCEVMVGRRKNLIGVIYRPPNAEVGYWNKVEESIERAKATNIKQISVLGDMNCNLLVRTQN